MAQTWSKSELGAALGGPWATLVFALGAQRATTGRIFETKQQNVNDAHPILLKKALSCVALYAVVVSRRFRQIPAELHTFSPKSPNFPPPIPSFFSTQKCLLFQIHNANVFHIFHANSKQRGTFWQCRREKALLFEENLRILAKKCGICVKA